MGIDEPLAAAARVDGSDLVVTLVDGSEVRAPMTFFPYLAEASDDQLANYRIIAGGIGIQWPDLDVDVETNFIVESAMDASDLFDKIRREAGWDS